MRAQSLAGLYLAGATLAMVSLALPHAAQVNEAAIAALAGIAYVVSAYVLARFDRLTIAEIDACVVGGALLIAGAVYFTHAEGSPYALFFVWTSLYGAYFFSRLRLAAYTAIVAGSYAGVLVILSGSDAPADRWLITIGTMIVCSALVIVLRERIDRLIGSLSRAGATQAGLQRAATAVASQEIPLDSFGTITDELDRLVGADFTAVIRFEASGFVVEYHHPRAPPGAAMPDQAEALLEAVAGVDPDVVSGTLGSDGWHAVHARIASAGRRWGAIVVAAAVGNDLAPDAGTVLTNFAQLAGLAVTTAENQRRLSEQALTDHLTGLVNHRAFFERLTEEIDRGRRHDRPLSVVVLDLDHFKTVNDTYGHPVGDGVLSEVARRLAGVSRPGDVLGRLGGEEFAWLLPECDAADALAAAERARAAIDSTAFPLVGPLTISAGIAEMDEARNGAELMRQADQALYWAKAEGRNICIPYSPEMAGADFAEREQARASRLQAMASIRLLALAVDAKDPHTQRHSERVAALARMLAVALGWAPERTGALHEAALVHDVGKIGVPDAILFKPGPLDAHEHGQVQRHAALGATMVSEVLSSEQVAWVRHHHERWDGAGYPDGLAAETIPDGATLIALADAWDTMTSDRPYRTRRSPEEALEEIRREGARQFSPTAVDALTRLWQAGEVANISAAVVSSV